MRPAGSDLALFHRVLNIVLNGAGAQMRRIYAKRVITPGAVVQNPRLVFRDWAITQTPRKTMRTNAAAIEGKGSIPSIRYATDPNPASTWIGFIYPAPKPCEIIFCGIDRLRKVYKFIGTFIHSSIMFGLSEGRLLITGGLCALIMLCGCSINKLIPPPYAAAIVEHNRFFGISAAYQGYGVKLGWGSQVWSLIPVNTNKLYSAPISDTFRLGQNINPFNTTITEDLQTFSPDGPPPAPRYMRLFSPKDTDTNNAAMRYAAPREK